MNRDFAAAMRRATASVRAQNLTEATAIIQGAIRGRMSECGDTNGPSTARSQLLTTLDPDSDARPETTDAGPSIRLAPFARREHARTLRSSLDGVAGHLAGSRLAGVLAGLRRGVSARSGPTVLPDLPEGAQFLQRSYTCQAGTRAYRLYVPACAVNDLQGLIVMLHGCQQTPEDFALGTGMNAVAEANRLVVAYPGQTSASNPALCWNWFDQGHQGRDAGEPRILAGLTRDVATEFAIPRERTLVAGLSAGGAMALVMAATYPDLYGAVGAHSGLAYGSAHDVRSALEAMRGQRNPLRATPSPEVGATSHPRVIVLHGSADATVHPSNAERIVALARSVHPATSAPAERHGDHDGRPWTSTVFDGPDGRPVVESWRIEGAGHAWSGGQHGGSFTDLRGPDASAEMVRFLLQAPERTRR